MLSEISAIVYHATKIVQIFIFISNLYFFCISIFGFIKRKENTSFYPPQKRFALVTAAHNEEKVIGHIIDSLANLNYPRNMYDIIIVADNCTDRTAEIARKKNAIVFERYDGVNRGKGYALDWVFKKLLNRDNRYDAVCVFDADNLVTQDFLIHMNQKLCEGHKVIQGYVDSKNPFDSWISCSYSIAFWISNRLFQLPRYYLGLSCGLCGTGFCIDVDLLKEIGWGTSSLTEDLEFTMKLALNNYKVAWAHEAVVYDEKPLTLKQSWKQRKRWMQGHADCAGRYLIPLFSKAFREASVTAFDCGVYLFQPISFIFLGFGMLLMWFQTVFPESPIYTLKYMFPPVVWYIIVFIQSMYGPLTLLLEKRLSLKVICGFITFPLYCLTWVPIAIQGLLSKGNKNWYHTPHTRSISLEELKKA